MRNSTGGHEEGIARNQFSGDSEAVVQADTIHGDIHVRGRAGSRLPPPRQLPMGITGFTNRVPELAALDSLQPALRGDMGSEGCIPAPARASIDHLRQRPQCPPSQICDD
jgi:hypothetical protein